MTLALDTYFAALSCADARTALDVLERARSAGRSRADLLREVVVPAQRRVGERWFEGSWTVADEHAATAVSEQALFALAPPSPPLADASRVLVACAEGEWHTLPARIAGELARADDLHVTFLGPSLPADQLQRHVVATQADVVALSCTMPTNLISAARSIEAARAAGALVVVGGRAWGQGDRRARRLGADLRLDDPARLAALLPELLAEPSADPVPLPAEALLLDVVPEERLVLALELQSAADPWVRRMTPYQRTRTREDLRWLARHAAAAVACDDASVLSDLLDWLVALLTPRGVPLEPLLDSCRFLADAVEPEAPAAAALLRDEADSAQARAAS